MSKTDSTANKDVGLYFQFDWSEVNKSGLHIQDFLAKSETTDPYRKTVENSNAMTNCLINLRNIVLN